MLAASGPSFPPLFSFSGHKWEKITACGKLLPDVTGFLVFVRACALVFAGLQKRVRTPAAPVFATRLVTLSAKNGRPTQNLSQTNNSNEKSQRSSMRILERRQIGRDEGDSLPPSSSLYLQVS